MLGHPVSDWRSRPLPWAVALIFVTALAIRLFLLAQVRADVVIPHTRWELEAIAWSLVESGRFADPYAVPTGPTAHYPPVYPFLLGLTWRIFGLGPTGGYAGWTMGFTLASLQCALLPWLSVRLGLGLAAGVITGLVSAVLAQVPPFLEPPSALLLGLLMLAFRRRWTSGGITTTRSLLLGLGAGLAFHLQPALLLVVLGCLAFELWWTRDARRWVRAGGVALAAFLVCLPWAWRNYTTLHGVFFIRSNLGLELLVGNHPGAAADIDDMLPSVYPLHPRSSVEQALRVREIGELAFMREAGAEARAWIAANPARYARLSAERALAFWTRWNSGVLYAVPATLATLLGLLGAVRVLRGLAVPERGVLLIPLLTFPLVYYFVDYLPRYRMPVMWIMYLFAAAEVWQRVRRPAAPPEETAAPR